MITLTLNLFLPLKYKYLVRNLCDAGSIPMTPSFIYVFLFFYETFLYRHVKRLGSVIKLN